MLNQQIVALFCAALSEFFFFILWLKNKNEFKLDEIEIPLITKYVFNIRMFALGYLAIFLSLKLLKSNLFYPLKSGLHLWNLTFTWLFLLT